MKLNILLFITVILIFIIVYVIIRKKEHFIPFTSNMFINNLFTNKYLKKTMYCEKTNTCKQSDTTPVVFRVKLNIDMNTFKLLLTRDKKKNYEIPECDKKKYIYNKFTMLK